MAGKKRTATLVITAENKASAVFKRASGDLKAFGSDVARMTPSLATMGKVGAAAIGVLGIASGVAAKQFYDLVRASGDAVDGMGETAQKLGITTAALQKYQIAAKYAGAETGSVEKALGFLNRTVGKIRSGIEDIDGKNGGVLKSLGLSEEDIRAADPGEIFEKVVTGLSKIQDPAERTAKSMQLLGRGAGDLNILFQQGAPALERAAKLIKDYGIGIDDLDSQKVGEMNDKFDDLGIVLDFAKKKLVVELAPVITEITGDLLELAKEGKGIGPAIAEGAKLGIEALKALGVVARAVFRETSQNTTDIFGMEDSALKGRAILDRIEEARKALERASGLSGKQPSYVAAGRGGDWEELREFLTEREEMLNTFNETDVKSRITKEIEELEKALKGLPPEIQATANAYKELAEIEAELAAGNITAESAKAREDAIRNELKLVEQRWDVERQLAAESERRTAAAKEVAKQEEEAAKAAERKGEAEKKVVEHLEEQAEVLGPLGQMAKEIREEDAWDGMVLPPLEDFGASAEDALPPVENLADAIGDGPESVAGSYKRASEASDKFREVSTKNAEVIVKDMEKTYDILNDYGDSVTGNIEKAIDSFTRDGKLDMGEFARSILADLAAITLKAAILGGIMGNSQYGGNGSGLIGATLSGFFSGGSGAAASYAGGGFTGMGARSGGVDGKGGFPAILHPNETVIDHTKGGGGGSGPVNVTQNIIVRETMPAGVARQIAAEAKRGAVAEMLGISQRGGSRRKSFAF